MKSNQVGDTLVEVLFAVTLLSVVLASAYTLSNRATRINQQAFERTQVSALLQQQAEFIRSARDLYNPRQPSTNQSTPWRTITNSAPLSVPPLGDACNDIPGLSASRTNEKFVTPRAATAPDDPGLAVNNGIQNPTDLYNIWFEIERNTTGDYWTVYIYGCWLTSSGAEENNKASLIVRLRDPSL